MTQTTNYDLNIVEGSDVVNPLVQTNPNFQTIDAVMKANEIRGIAIATEVKSGTNHAITRNIANAVFRFIATSDFRSGDTFSVDGTTVTATLVDGTLPKDRAFVVGTNVVCILDGIRLTFVNATSSVYADDVNYNNAQSGLEADNVQSAIDEMTNQLNSLSANNIAYNGSSTVASALNSLKTDKIGFLHSGYLNTSSEYIFADKSTGNYLVALSGYDSYSAGIILAQRFSNGSTNIVKLANAEHFNARFNSSGVLVCSTDNYSQGVFEVIEF